MNCKICGGETREVGQKRGRVANREFLLRRCPACGFSFVADPWLDFAAIYNVEYYEGRGADPMVDYRFELENPRRTLRRYEWSGVLRVVRALCRVSADTRWLDFGCGAGGLIRHVSAEAGCHAFGFEEGGVVPLARSAGITVLDRPDLRALQGTFDVVTAIEVLEHVTDPLAVLREIRGLLRPGGLFFYTTGNAQKRVADLLRWAYFIPEIHISQYEPSSLERALTSTGFRTQYPGYVAGWDMIIAFKVLKNLGRRTTMPLDRLVPWRALAPAINRRFGVHDFPVGIATA